MTSGNTTHNLPPVNGADKTWKVIGGRASPEHRKVIDIASAMLGKKRGHFVIETALERAVQILGPNGVEDALAALGNESSAGGPRERIQIRRITRGRMLAMGSGCMEGTMPRHKNGTNYHANDPVIQALAVQWGCRLETAHQYLYGRNRVNVRTADAVTAFLNNEAHLRCKRFLDPIDRARANLVIPGLTPDLLLELQRVDQEEDMARIVHVVGTSRQTLDDWSDRLKAQNEVGGRVLIALHNQRESLP
jgi:hypothetical protein